MNSSIRKSYILLRLVINMSIKFAFLSVVNFVNDLRQYRKDTGVFSTMESKYKNMYLVGSLIAFLAVMLSYLSEDQKVSSASSVSVESDCKVNNDE